LTAKRINVSSAIILAAVCSVCKLQNLGFKISMGNPISIRYN
jgi:hypothetical protein